MKDNSQTSESNRDSGILSNPLSFLRSGIFYWSSADPYDRSGSGYYWSLRSATTTHSCNLNFGSTGLNPQNLNGRGNGYAVRCVSNTEWSGGLAPDSICPKGWQLPTNSGDKSFITLISTSYSMKNYTQTSESSQDSGVLSNPLSFLRSGGFSWYSTSPDGRGVSGNYWSLRSAFSAYSSYLTFGNASLGPQNNYSRGNGFAVRLRTNPSPLSLILAIP